VPGGPKRRVSEFLPQAPHVEEGLPRQALFLAPRAARRPVPDQRMYGRHRSGCKCTSRSMRTRSCTFARALELTLPATSSALPALLEARVRAARRQLRWPSKPSAPHALWAPTRPIASSRRRIPKLLMTSRSRRRCEASCLGTWGRCVKAGRASSQGHLCGRAFSPRSCRHPQRCASLVAAARHRTLYRMSSRLKTLGLLSRHNMANQPRLVQQRRTAQGSRRQR